MAVAVVLGCPIVARPIIRRVLASSMVPLGPQRGEQFTGPPGPDPDASVTKSGREAGPAEADVAAVEVHGHLTTGVQQGVLDART